MKTIETIYACISREAEEETICGFGNANGMQALSSNKDLMEHAVSIFKRNDPTKDYYIVAFERKNPL